MDCIFCKIASGVIPSNKVFEDEEILAFYDLDPQAPTHILLIPKTHVASFTEIDRSNSKMVARIFEVTAMLAKELGLENGYRVVTNCGESAGQSVQHLHFHLLSGRDFTWPPG